MPHRLAPLLILLALPAACAPPVAELPPPPYPEATRERMLRIAEGEWREWGAHLLDARRAPQAEAAAPPIAEENPAAFSKVLAYWSAVGWTGEIARNKRAFTLGQPTTCTEAEQRAGARSVLWGCQPWSAAFLSFVLRATGVDEAEFPPSAAHWVYVDAMLRQSDRWGPRATFQAHELVAHAPAPGDIVCADRGSPPLETLAQRRTEAGTARPMHCDIVLATAPGEITIVGGNVAQSVTAIRHATDPAGRLPPGPRRWFAVFENRMGRMGTPAPSAMLPPSEREGPIPPCPPPARSSSC